MSRKDYIKFADLLAQVKPRTSKTVFSALCDGMVTIFKGDNELFDEDRFLARVYGYPQETK